MSSDDEVRRKLAEILGHGGLAPVVVSTVPSRTAWSGDVRMIFMMNL